MKCFKFNIVDSWILVSEYTSKDFFNNTEKIVLDYGETEIENLKPNHDPNWHMKLTYEGYPNIQLPHLIWCQTSNPFTQNEVEGFKIIENNLKR